MTRDELVECMALLAGGAGGQLDLLGRRRSRSTSWPSRSWPRSASAEWARTSLFDLVPSGRPLPDLTGRTSTRWSSWCPRGSRPGGAGGVPTSTATG